MAVARSIWTLWLQGWDSAPRIIQVCHESWVRRNPDWTVHALTNESLALFDAFLPARCPTLSVAAYSDLVRTSILAAFGGVWVDASVYCMWPLDWWVDEVAASGFFAFRLTSLRPLATWFLAADPEQPLIGSWAERTRAYYAAHESIDEYFWMALQFELGCREDPLFAAAWAEVPAMSAAGPHAFCPPERRLSQPMPEALRERMVSRVDPVYKLSHRGPQSFPPGSAGAFFLENRP